ncbi:unnamed protein product [Brassica rapa]|uniref:Uncharacterized protein n=1 Tax=Brassica campestris TaxID=3711 RepID=A0A8D9D8K7_BRACM|nr:unnamed protein product [Brassica rapa]
MANRKVKMSQYVYMFEYFIDACLRFFYFIVNQEKFNPLICFYFFYLCVFRGFDQEAGSKLNLSLCQTKPQINLIFFNC